MWILIAFVIGVIIIYCIIAFAVFYSDRDEHDIELKPSQIKSMIKINPAAWDYRPLFHKYIYTPEHRSFHISTRTYFEWLMLAHWQKKQDRRRKEEREYKLTAKMIESFRKDLERFKNEKPE